jgi:23S rRNA (cytidine1920-2'-O)/16S rRNA (cytidine1409-2'-O)-methyltransferase
VLTIRLSDNFRDINGRELLGKKKRLDQLIVERGLISSREAARTAIMDGAVLVDGEKQTKPGESFSDQARIELLASFSPNKFVSRGGLKLEKALDEFAIDVSNKICLDVGASTGGFTHCLLQRGAAFVYAVDVGYGQLDWSLRKDERVKVMERTNARYLTREFYLSERSPATFACMDVSFISITKILPALKDVADQVTEMQIVCLVKPQFEAGRQAIGKGGVVKSAETHLAVLETVAQAAQQLELSVLHCTYSPIKGPAGNIEFLLHLSTTTGISTAIDFREIVHSSASL